MQRKCASNLADFCFEIKKNVFVIHEYLNAKINLFTFVPVNLTGKPFFSSCLQIKTVITGRQEVVSYLLWKL